MNIRLMLISVLVALVLPPLSSAFADPVAPVLSFVPIQKVGVDDPFWSPKLAVWRSVTMNDCFDKFDRVCHR